MKAPSSLLAFCALGLVSCLQDESVSAHNSQNELSSSSLSSTIMSSTALSSSASSSSRISSSTALSSSAQLDSCTQEFGKWLGSVQPHDTVFHVTADSLGNGIWAKQVLATLDSAEKTSPSSWPNLKIAATMPYNVQAIWQLSYSDTPLKTATFTCIKPHYSSQNVVIFDPNRKVLSQSNFIFDTTYTGYAGSNLTQRITQMQSSISHKNKQTFITVSTNNFTPSNSILLDTNTVYQQH